MHSMEAAPCRLSPSKNVAAPETESKHSPIFGRLRIDTGSDGHYENVSVSRVSWSLILQAGFQL
jgi:hypothetical protein